jgi:hypothetical protein
MADSKSCSHIATCALFPLMDKQPLLKVWQSNYCRGDYMACARYRLAQSGMDVPLTLLPSGQSLKKTASK